MENIYYFVVFRMERIFFLRIFLSTKELYFGAMFLCKVRMERLSTFAYLLRDEFRESYPMFLWGITSLDLRESFSIKSTWRLSCLPGQCVRAMYLCLVRFL